MSGRVVLVHGIWMPAVSLQFLANELESEHGYDARLFGYASVRGSVDENAALLADYLAGEDGTHVVGHSLGGIVALRMLRNHGDVRVGRIVCLGSPLTGSRAATELTRHGWGRTITGLTLAGGVLEEPAADWARDVFRRYDVGSIAGTLPYGAGRLLTDFDGANDGTVAVAETDVPGLRDHLCLPVSHSGLVLSNDVAARIAAFLRDGRFAAPTSPP